MGKNKYLYLTRTIYFLFFIATIASILIVYRGFNSSIAFKFLMGYLFFTFFLLLYVPIITIVNSRKLKWFEIRKRLFKFIFLFILFGVVNYTMDFFFRPLKVDLFRELSIALGLAFGISFFDVTFSKEFKSPK